MRTFFFRDYAIFSYPLAAHHRDSFLGGELPLWNPYNHLGIPYLAQWNTMLFYPLSLIYLLLPVPWSVNLFCLVHLYLAGLGLYFLVRFLCRSNIAAAISGVLFTFNGFSLSCVKWTNNIAALGLLPWVLLSIILLFKSPNRRTFSLAAIAAVFQMLSGAPELIILTWLIVFALMIGSDLGTLRSRFCSIAALVPLVAALAAIQLLPFLDLLAHSQRNSNYAASEWSMPIWGWANFLVPLFRTFPSYHGVVAQPEQYWISTYYLSLPGLLLALVALFLKGNRHIFIFSGLALAGLLLCLGDAALIYKLLRESIPALGFMRYPIKFILLPIVAFSIMAGYGAAHLLTGAASPRRLYTISGALAILTLLVTFIGWQKPLPEEIPSATLTNGLIRIAWLLPGTLLSIWLLKHRNLPFATLAFIMLLYLDSITHAPNHNPRASIWGFDRGTLELASPPKLGQTRAMISPGANWRMDHQLFNDPNNDLLTSRLGLFANINLIDRIPKVDGFFSLEPPHSAEFQKILYGSTNAFYPSLLAFIGVGPWSNPNQPIEWQQRPGMPLLTGGQAVIEYSREQLLKTDLARAVLISNVTASPLAGREPAAFTILSSNLQPHRILVQAEADRDTVLVIAQTHYHWWNATVDGTAVPLLKANLAFQALPFPKGRHTVELRYQDQSFRIGFLISAIATLFLLGLILSHTRSMPTQ